MAKPDPSLSPEQQLLSLIEGQDSKDKGAGDSEKSQDAKAGETSASVKKEAPHTPAAAKKTLSLSAMKGRIAFTRDKWSNAFRQGPPKIDLNLINKWVRVFVLVLGGALIMALAYDSFQLATRDYVADFTQPKSVIERLPISDESLFNADLFEDAQDRNVFSATAKTGAPVDEEADTSISMRLVEMTQDLKLAGISMNAEEPSRTFCMIEDLQKNMTSFLREGDMISGMTVAKISTDGVILRYKKEQIEIR